LIPAEIQYLLDNYDEEDINVLITNADYSGDVPRLSFKIYEPDAEPQNWAFEVIGHRASEISFSSEVDNYAMLITDDHPFLWQFSDIQTELYYKGSSKDIYRVISELNQIDFQLFGKYQNPSVQLYTLLRASNGSLGKGPKKLLTKYEKCLNKYGIETSIVGGYIPTYWDGRNKLSGDTLKIFLINGSYIVGQDFVFTRQD
jgi:hypothetical protein